MNLLSETSLYTSFLSYKYEAGTNLVELQTRCSTRTNNQLKLVIQDQEELHEQDDEQRTFE